MKTLTELPIIFVNYPLGAGGWFLSSMIQKGLTPSVNLQVDRNGSGHANTYVYHINNFYHDNLLSDIGKAIIADTDYDKWSREDRLVHLHNSVKINANSVPGIVISLHCVNLDLFIDAFPNAKFVCIDIEPHHVRKCRFNVLHKALKEKPELLKGLAVEYNKPYNECLEKINNLSTNLDYFDWVDNEVKKFSPKKKYSLNNILHVQYEEYLTGEEDTFLEKLFNFFNIAVTEEIVDSLALYRFSQPQVPQ